MFCVASVVCYLHVTWNGKSMETWNCQNLNLGIQLSLEDWELEFEIHVNLYKSKSKSLYLRFFTYLWWSFLFLWIFFFFILNLKNIVEFKNVWQIFKMKNNNSLIYKSVESNYLSHDFFTVHPSRVFSLSLLSVFIFSPFISRSMSF